LAETARALEDVSVALIKPRGVMPFASDHTKACLPSDEEAFPTTVVPSAESDRPFVESDVPPPPREMINDSNLLRFG
jgi:hypothetical protein